ncbi:peptidylprolyl isomerase [Polynucleobacter sp. MWH-Spelu-300-X4]|uniref:peptidylprolyl isomerase n=1 Tax=Polynucleobacter sp. MWH-Spelu-300-X4 TaxID=2689109 RepID=UPI001BFEB272|nr:peptidylprolyl isomerase [Polynucleobacter sp. MWH-Spelu-300-X4]QWD79429.1 peptidylprolyl isomerase [Polynucleobacter sp. MWH-Spelu-300-X4]
MKLPASFIKSALLTTSLFLCSQLALAQTGQTNPKDNEATSETTSQVPAVNLLLHGIVLDKDLFEFRLQNALQNGQTDSTELRIAIRDELYNRALLMEQAKNAGFTKNKSVKLLAQETQENVYIDLVFQEYLKSHAVTDRLLKAEYDRLVKELSPQGVLVEYHLATIAVADEKLAQEILDRTKTVSFSQLATEYSIDASASNGGDLGWVNVVQLSPALKAALPHKNQPHIIKNPIQIGRNWHIIKFFERREGKPSSFAESKERLKPAVIQKLRQEHIEELRQARIQVRGEK